MSWRCSRSAVSHYGILGNNRRKRDIEAARAIFQVQRLRRGASVPQRRRSTLQWNVLSVVRKNRNSSGGLYRCRRHSAHDRRRTNAMRFLMKVLMLRPAPRLMNAFRQNLSGYARALAAALAIRGYSRGAITALNLLAPVQSCFSKLLARQYMHPNSLPAFIYASSPTVLSPDAEQRQG
jgi:hypothetical protein